MTPEHAAGVPHVAALIPAVGMYTYPFATVGRAKLAFVKVLTDGGVQLVELLHQSRCRLLAS